MLIFPSKRYFRVSPTSLYEDADIGSENAARRNIPNILFIRNHPAYLDLFFHYDLHQVETEITHPAVKNFIAIARSSPDEHVFHVKYKGEVDALIASLQELTEVELQYALFHLRLFSYPKDKVGKVKFAKIWMPFDDECLRRGVERKKWRVPISFVYANLWDLLLLGSKSTFHWIVIKTCFRKVKKLYTSQIRKYYTQTFIYWSRWILCLEKNLCECANAFVGQRSYPRISNCIT